jgi:hypothetical protein
MEDMRRAIWDQKIVLLVDGLDDASDQKAGEHFPREAASPGTCRCHANRPQSPFRVRAVGT